MVTMASLDAVCDSITPLGSTTTSAACCKLVESLTSNSSLLTVLPEELIVKILEWCDFKEVIACQLVCERTPLSTMYTLLMLLHSPHRHAVLSGE
jgi:F-box domain